MNLNKIEKTAVFLISLGAEHAANILKQMPDTDKESIMREIVKWENVPVAIMKTVVEEMSTSVTSPNFQGGKNYARKIMENMAPRLYLEDKKDYSKSKPEPKSKLDNIDPQKFGEIIKKEHPQTIAFMLINISPELSAEILKYLPTDLQIDVSKRMTHFSEIKKETLADIEQIVEKKYSSFLNSDQEVKKINGINMLASILNESSPNIKDKILTELERQVPFEVINSVKEQMFSFEDIIYLSDMDIQLILKEIRTGDLAIALKAASDELKEKIFQNMSKRAVEIMTEEISMLPPIRISDVRSIQKSILKTVNNLAADGKIVISRQDEEFV